MIPVLRERAEEGEKLRRCPDQTVREYVDAGLLRVCQPSRYGGYDLGYDVLCEVIQTLARGDGSQAWVYMVLGDNPLKLAAYEIAAQDDVWGQDSTKKLCVAVSPVGRATRVNGGVVWNGLHGFSSGIDHADWVMCGGFEYDADGKKGRGLSALMPTSDVRIIDDWHVVGLAGTGSKSFEVKDVFIPEHRLLDKQANDEGRAPGALFYKAPVTRLPRGGVSAVSYTAVVVGVAQGFLDEFLKITGTAQVARQFGFDQRRDPGERRTGGGRNRGGRAHVSGRHPRNDADAGARRAGLAGAARAGQAQRVLCRAALPAGRAAPLQHSGRARPLPRLAAAAHVPRLLRRRRAPFARVGNRGLRIWPPRARRAEGRRPLKPGAQDDKTQGRIGPR